MTPGHGQDLPQADRGFRPVSTRRRPQMRRETIRRRRLRPDVRAAPPDGDAHAGGTARSSFALAWPRPPAARDGVRGRRGQRSSVSPASIDANPPPAASLRSRGRAAVGRTPAQRPRGVLAVSSVGARERVEEHAGAPAVARLGEHLKPEQPRHGVAVECRGCETERTLPSSSACLSTSAAVTASRREPSTSDGNLCT